MKKLLLCVLLVAAVSVISQAQLKFYYYPGTNVYYDVSQSRYVYLNNGTWTPVKVLPTTIKVVNTPRYIVYNKTPDVWVVNKTHIQKYKAVKPKNYPNGKAVGYKAKKS